VVARRNGVHHRALVAQAQIQQLAMRARGLAQGGRIGTRHEHDGGARRIRKRLQPGAEALLLHLQPRVRPQAGCTAVVAFEEAGPGPGQAQQAQGVAGGCGVEDDVVVALGVVGQQADEFIEGGDLCRAGTGELLAHGATLGVGAPARHLVDHARPVVLRCRLGVDVQSLEARRAGDGRRPVGQHDAEHLVAVGGRIRADQQHALTGVGEREGAGAGQ
jgi:hypothetical protein